MKKPKFLYHGSGKRLEVLEPRQPTGHNPGHDRKGVYATDLKDIKRVGYYSTTKRGTKDTKYSANMIARVKKIKPQTLDPAEGEIPKRKFIKSKDFNKYCNWGENGEFQLKKAMEKLREE